MLGLVGVKLTAEGNVLDIEKEDKIRQFHPIDSLFDYFSSYQLVDGKGKCAKKKEIKCFYNSTFDRQENHPDEWQKLLQCHDPRQLHWPCLWSWQGFLHAG